MRFAFLRGRSRWDTRPRPVTNGLPDHSTNRKRPESTGSNRTSPIGANTGSFPYGACDFNGALGRIRTCAHGLGNRSSIP